MEVDHWNADDGLIIFSKSFIVLFYSFSEQEGFLLKFFIEAGYMRRRTPWRDVFSWLGLSLHHRVILI